MYYHVLARGEIPSVLEEERAAPDRPPTQSKLTRVEADNSSKAQPQPHQLKEAVLPGQDS